VKLLDDAIEARQRVLDHFGCGEDWMYGGQCTLVDDTERYWHVDRSTVYMYSRREVEYFRSQYLTGNNTIWKGRVHRTTDFTLIVALRNLDGRYIYQILDNKKEISP
jgi:hypothetical protein